MSEGLIKSWISFKPPHHTRPPLPNPRPTHPTPHPLPFCQNSDPRTPHHPPAKPTTHAPPSRNVNRFFFCYQRNFFFMNKAQMLLKKPTVKIQGKKIGLKNVSFPIVDTIRRYNTNNKSHQNHVLIVLKNCKNRHVVKHDTKRCCKEDRFVE